MCLFSVASLVCCGPTPSTETTKAPTDDSPPSSTQGSLKPSVLSLDSVKGGVTGIVTLKGTPRSQDESFYAGASGCGENPIRHSENWKVGPQGELADVVVWVVDPNFSKGFGGAVVQPSLKQIGCRYEPHVLVLRAGEDLAIINGDPTLHNIRAKTYDGPGKPPGTDVFNFGQSYQGQKDDREFDQPGIYTLQCDVHNWMECWVMVLPATLLPAADVTAKDGTFRIRFAGLMADGDYKIRAWHPRFAETLEKTVHVKDGVATVNFQFDGAKSF